MKICVIAYQWHNWLDNSQRHKESFHYKSHILIRKKKESALNLAGVRSRLVTESMPGRLFSKSHAPSLILGTIYHNLRNEGIISVKESHMSHFSISHLYIGIISMCQGRQSYDSPTVSPWRNPLPDCRHPWIPHQVPWNMYSWQKQIANH